MPPQNLHKVYVHKKKETFSRAYIINYNNSISYIILQLSIWHIIYFAEVQAATRRYAHISTYMYCRSYLQHDFRLCSEYRRVFHLIIGEKVNHALKIEN